MSKVEGMQMKVFCFATLLSIGCAEPYYLVSNRAIEDARKSDIPAAQETEVVVVPATRLPDRREVDLRFREIKDSIQPYGAAYSYVLTSNRSLQRLGAGLLVGGVLLLIGGGVGLGMDLNARSPSSGALTMVVGLPLMTLGSVGVIGGSITLGLGFRHAAEHG